MVFKNSALKYLIISTVLILSACANHVNFKGYSFKPGEELNLSGIIYKPSGDGPFPAVVILHGCSGISNRTYLWASRLKDWGYVTFLVDSLGPRGVYDTCQRTLKVSYIKRAMDAYSAKAHLSTLPFVDREKVGVIGFSHGAAGILFAADKSFTESFLPALTKEKSELFKAAIAFYPYCQQYFESNAPLLILSGGLDDWTPAQHCVDLVKSMKKKADHEVRCEVYPGAYHCFDNPGANKTYMGHKLKYNSAAATDAKEQVKAFFNKYLNK